MNNIQSNWNKSTTCYGCGVKLHTVSILICAECLAIESGEFLRLAQEVISEELQNLYLTTEIEE